MQNPSLNRREFLSGAVAASVLTLSQPFSVFSEVSKLAEPKICAFEKPLQFLDFDDLAQLMADLKFSGIEAAVRDGGHVLPERVEEDLPRMVDALKKRGLEVTILTSSINQVDQPHAEKVLRTAARLGIKQYRMLWYRYDLKRPILPQLDALRPKITELAALNRELGITGLYQNHAGEKYVGATLWDIYSLVKDLNPRDMALAYDIRHAVVESGLSWPIPFHLVKSHIGAVFVKDFVWEKGNVKNVPLGDGLIGTRFFEMLKETKFSGPISLHVEYIDAKSRDKELIANAFKKDLATLRSLI